MLSGTMSGSVEKQIRCGNTPLEFNVLNSIPVSIQNLTGILIDSSICIFASISRLPVLELDVLLDIFC
jgi:hypothetical protein